MNAAILSALVYGSLAILGGLVGYFKAGSQVSLFSGGLSGLLLIGAAGLQLSGRAFGQAAALAMTALLTIFFLVRLVKTKKWMPSGVMGILGVASLAIMVGQF